MTNFKKITLGILGATILSLGLYACSNDDAYVDTSLTDKQSNEESLIKVNAMPVWPIIVALKILSNTVDGKYYKDTEYNSDGSIRSQKEGCRGFLGTCTMPSTTKGSSESLSLSPTSLDYIENENSRVINAELIKTDFGILYAINKSEYSEDCDFFFNSSIKEITGELIIDNPNVLNELQIAEPIIVHGEYIVQENNDYKYIIIDEQ